MRNDDCEFLRGIVYLPEGGQYFFNWLPDNSYVCPSRSEVGIRISRKDHGTFQMLFDLSKESKKFDCVLPDSCQLHGCFVSCLEHPTDSRRSCSVNICFDFAKIPDKYKITPVKVKSFDSSEDSIIEKILEELDIWLTDPFKYSEMKDKGLIKYV